MLAPSGKRAWPALAALGSVALLVACDGAAPLADAGSDAPVSRARVEGEVRYDGDADGSLLVGIFPWDDARPSMPSGPPLEFVAVAQPSFPVRYELARLRPGTYFVGAVLDVGRDSPTIPGPEDLAVYTGMITLSVGDAITVDLELRDP